MSIRTIKFLRTISKIVLLVVGIAIIGYGGLMIYKSVSNKPQRVRITNVTDSAATITWVTDNPVRGVVYYKDKGTFLPGPFGLIGSKVAYDDRDFAKAQDECVKAFNENAKNTKDEDFAVDGNNFDCENIPVEKLGAYYTHSVTIKDLNDSSTYFFVVGNGIWSWSVDGVDKDISDNDLAVTNSFNFKTGKLLEEVPTPNIAYGTVVAKLKYSDGEGEAYYEDLSKDSLVFSYLEINGQKSQIISSVTNSSGGWIFDKSNFRDTEGNLITDLSKAKMIACAQYEDLETRGCVEAMGDLTVDTELELMGNSESDLTGMEKNIIREKFKMLIEKVYAVEGTYPVCSNCDCSYDGATYSSGGSSGTSGCKIPYSSSVGKCKGTKDGYQIEKWFSLVAWSNDLPSWCSSGSTDEAICQGKVVKIPDICSQSNPGSCSAPTGAGAGQIQNIRDEIASCNTNGGGGGGTLKNCKDDDGKKIKPNVTCPIHGGKCDGTTGKCTDSNDGGGTTGDKCLDGTGVGKCNTLGRYCSKADQDTIINYAKCYCSDVGSYKKPNGECVESRGMRCKLNNSGLPEVSGESCSGSIQPPEIGNCSVGYKRDSHDAIMGCSLICMKNGQTYSEDISKNKCLDLLRGYDGDDAEVVIVDIQDQNVLDLLYENDEWRSLLERQFKSIQEQYLDKKCGTKEEYDKYKKNLAVADENCKKQGFKGAKGICVKQENCVGDLSYVICSIDRCASAEGNVLNESLREKEIIKKTYAQDDPSDGYTLYLPEYGMYSFQFGDYTLATDTTDGNTIYVFYVEINNKLGFQMPEDPDNPTADEDIMLKSNSAAIKHTKVSSAQTYTLEKGINIISFNFIPVSTELGTLTAAQVIEQAAKKNVDIQYISSFEGGRWAKGYTCKNDKCSGNDFNIIPGKGYLVYVTKGGDISIGGYDLKSSIPVNLSGGWNLVGIHGYTNAYTAASLIESINKIDGITANNVTWWPTSKGMYEGLQVTGTQQYGLDFPISPTNGYFVRISSFKPEDAECKSLLWNEGGTLNGACGVTK